MGRAARAASRSVVLLTEAGQLVDINPRLYEVTVHEVQGLSPLDRLWGLACLQDRWLWTTVSPRTLLRLDALGRILERVASDIPVVALFGAPSGGLLVQQMPVPVGQPALSLTIPGRPGRTPWPGLHARPGRSPREQIARNLVSCGIGTIASARGSASEGERDGSGGGAPRPVVKPRRGFLPCWFADADRVVLSDGSTVEEVVLPSALRAHLDRTSPIWDFALTARRRWWLLAKSEKDGPRGASCLVTGATTFHLPTPARLILHASRSSCLVATIDGRLLEASLR